MIYDPPPTVHRLSDWILGLAAYSVVGLVVWAVDQQKKRRK